jgi:hypothetical protein
MKICGLPELVCLAKINSLLKKLVFPPEELKKKLSKYGVKCDCPAGNTYIWLLAEYYHCNLDILLRL